MTTPATPSATQLQALEPAEETRFLLGEVGRLGYGQDEVRNLTPIEVNKPE